MNKQRYYPTDKKIEEIRFISGIADLVESIGKDTIESISNDIIYDESNKNTEFKLKMLGLLD